MGFSTSAFTSTMGSAMAVGGQVLGGLSSSAYGDARAALAQADALYERDAAEQEAKAIMRAARRQQGAARAATAASGARVDEFALIAEDEIGQLAAQDAAMTILTGNRRARSLEFSGNAARRAGRSELTGSLFQAASYGYNGWRGTKGEVKTEPFYDGTTGDFAFQG
jgi:hypothetical protein